MPALNMENHAVPAVALFSTLLKELLDHAEQLKPDSAIEPALQKSDFGDLPARLSSLLVDSTGFGPDDNADQKKVRQYAIIETAVRDMFSNLIATTAIDSPAFVKLWNLFDLLSILSDEEQCDPALLFWLIEELLDSQTISGCRIIFDFLESRRERITAKHFKQKQLVILRSCNELLRRLSRAEDTAFCGRVFIFMFQSFPLGDKSSVNLRGEYHVENVTTFDESGGEPGDATEKMEIDKQVNGAKDTSDSKPQSKGVSFDAKKPTQREEPLEPDVLYPLFWSLQESFSQPKKLFEPAQFSHFRRGLEATMTTFRAIHNEQGSRPSKSMDDTKRGLKRKREDGEEDDLTNSFNPKYLTSRDLFELEISDLSFRRHILVQALIVMDFLLSLSTKAKEKLASIKAQNKSVIYADQLLTDDDAKWSFEMKKTIADYLRQGNEGPYFYRMVETVLSRDKNWVRWKVENCPTIELPAVSPNTFVDARIATTRTTTNKRLRPVPMGSLPLDFLSAGDEQVAMQKLKAEERYQLPELDTFKRKIADDDFEIEMPTNNQTKAAAIESKASKSWRALRIASKTKLSLFDTIDDPEKIDPVFEEPRDADELEESMEMAVDIENLPQDSRPIIISGPSGAGKATLLNLLMGRRPGAFAKVVRHTTRMPQDGDIEGQSFHFVDAQTFNTLRDGDVLLEYSTVDGADYGTSRKAIEFVTTSGRVPVMVMDGQAVQQVKDIGFDARFLFISAPTIEALEERLKKAANGDSIISGIVEQATKEMEDLKTKDGFELVVVNDDLETAFKTFEDYIYKPSGGENPANGEPATNEADTIMVDTTTEEVQAAEEQT